ncbi:tryptophan 7-halogenase [Massilia sp. W12]|uniref:tryptophan 7-halogenase n=1 Tax=Massilia sp. W12 TaxID=3126507 RepID=UPI0030CF092E
MDFLAQQVEVAIIGAGPAGCAAACTLARLGCHPLLIEQAGAQEKPGQCLSANARNLLQELDLLSWIERSAPGQTAQGFSSWGQDELQICQFMQSAYAGGWLLDRGRFDSCLRAAALASGAEFLPARVLDVQAVENGWQLHLQQGKSGAFCLHAPWLIDASGRRAICATHFGLERDNDESLIALYACGPNRDGDTRNLIEAAPQGWWMSGIIPGERRIAALHVSAELAPQILHEPGKWRQMLLETRHISAICQQAKGWDAPHGCIASASRLRQPCGKRWLAVGDAALTFDPLATQGIVAALHSGAQGAQALLAARAGQSSALEAYAHWLQEMWRAGRKQLLAHYRTETRWPQEPFWACRHQAGRAAGD